MPSMKDVAHLAGVSYTTVSHVINKTRIVAPETTERVTEAIRRLGFVPNRTARSLRKGNTRTVGIITTSPEDLFFMEAMHGAFSVFDRENYDMYFSFSKPGQEWDYDRAVCNETEEISAMLSRGVEAFIVNSICGNDTVREYMAKAGRPFTLFQRSMPGTKSCTIVSNDFDGGYKAISHLVSAGKKHLAVIYGRTFDTHAAAHRKSGLDMALSDAGLDIREEYRIDCDYDPAVSYSETLRLLRRSDRPDGIFYYSDTLALTGLRAAADCGLRVPEDLAIIGYDNILQCEYSVPRLSSINQRKFEMGALMAENLLKQIRNQDYPAEDILLPVDLIVRESTLKDTLKSDAKR